MDIPEASVIDFGEAPQSPPGASREETESSPVDQLAEDETHLAKKLKDQKSEAVDSPPMDSTPVEKIEPSQSSEKADGDKADSSCCICIDDFLDDAWVARLPCGHVLHYGCAEQWLDEKDSCPMCRRTLPWVPRKSLERLRRLCVRGLTLTMYIVGLFTLAYLVISYIYFY